MDINELWDTYITILNEKKPALAVLLSKIQALTLFEYSKTYKFNESKNIQPREDLINETIYIASRLYGSDIGLKISKRFENSGVFTAHHQAVDFFSITIQTSIIASLGEEKYSCVPVFAGALIPIFSISFPKGIIMANKSLLNEVKHPPRVAIFAVKYDKFSVKYTTPFEKSKIQEFTLKELHRLYANKTVSKPLYDTTYKILKEDYLDETILAQKTYSDQISLLNQRIWKQVFKNDVNIPELSFIELEKWLIPIVIKDLENEASLLYQLLFDKKLRDSILESLDGVNGCWTRGLDKGTCFFWAVKEGKTYSLALEDDLLKGKHKEIAFEAKALIEALQKDEIVPSLFVLFTVLAFARGFKCIGGMMQIDYTTKMKEGIVKALQEVGNTDWAEKVASVETETYLAGLTAIVTDYGNGQIFPSGTIEIIANGGLSQEDMEKIKNLSVKEASLLGMPDVLKIITSAEEYKASGFDQYTVADIYELVKDKFVRIEM